MIVLWGPPADRPLAAVAAELDRRDIDTLLLDQRRVLEIDISLNVDEAVEGFVSLGSTRVELQRLRGIYVRPHDTRRVPALRNCPEGSPERQRAIEVDDMLNALCELTTARVLNRPSAMASNSSKPYQTERIRAFGLDVPRSLVTTDPEAVLAFEAEHGSIIYKSVSGVRSIVSRFGPEHRERLARVRWCPTQFQEYVPGVDWRVHVVGDKVFPCRIESSSDDYRYAKRQGGTTELHRDELPPEIAEACVRAAHGLNLPVAGVDLRRSPQGRWVCFEINPSPGFTWYEDRTGLPITAAIVDLFASAAA